VGLGLGCGVGFFVSGAGASMGLGLGCGVGSSVSGAGASVGLGLGLLVGSADTGSSVGFAVEAVGSTVGGLTRLAEGLGVVGKGTGPGEGSAVGGTVVG